MEHTIYDNGKYNSKTQMYEDCAKTFNVSTEDLLVFEDSPKSIKEAIASGCNNVVAVNKNMEMQAGIIQTINDFNEFDRSLL